MAGLFRRQRREPQGHVDPEEVQALLPASVRSPEANRFTPLGSDFDGDEGSDEDIEFLTSIVESVERERAMPGRPSPRPAPPPARKPPVQRMLAAGEAEAIDHLDLFREMQSHEPEARPRPIQVPEVDLADLLEELETTWAALRRRKAA